MANFKKGKHGLSEVFKKPPQTCFWNPELSSLRFNKTPTFTLSETPSLSPAHPSFFSRSHTYEFILVTESKLNYSKKSFDVEREQECLGSSFLEFEKLLNPSPLSYLISFISLSLSLSLTFTHTHAHTQTHLHELSLSHTRSNISPLTHKHTCSVSVKLLVPLLQQLCCVRSLF